MSKKERTGIKKPRAQRQMKRYELGNYRIVTDTDNSEKFFFEGLKKSLPPETRDKIEIVVSKKVRTKDLVDTAADIIENFKETWIVFDRDRVPDFDKLIQKANCRGINVAWSNPCIEIWFLAYYGIMPDGMDSVQCCAEFGRVFKKRTGESYTKNDDGIYRKLISSGDEKNAIIIADKKHKNWIRQCEDIEVIPPSKMNACTMMFEIVGEIRSKTVQALE